MPPFVQQQREEEQRRQKQQSAAATKTDPFGASTAAVEVKEKKVTLVVDDSSVQESEIGRQSFTRNYLVLVAGLLAGVVVGFMVGNTAGDRQLWNTVIRDAKDLYTTVDEVSRVVDQAKKQVQAISDAFRGGPGTKAKVDYAAIEQLVAIKKPLSASAFHRKQYKAFQAGTVDDLFDYYGNINVLWKKFSALGAKTADAKRRDALNRSAEAADQILNNQYGLVPREAGEKLVGGLVFVTIPPPQVDENGEPIASLTVEVSSKQSEAPVEKQRFVGQEEFSKKPEDYVILLNKSLSMGILGQPASLFGEYRRDVAQLSAIMDKTVEIQGRLIKTLSDVAAKY